MKFIYEGNSLKSGVYKIVNIANGRFYVGSAKRFKERGTCHLKSLRSGTHHNKFLQNDFNKCGEGAFEFRIIEIVEGDKQIRFLVEQKYLDQLYDHQDQCYNFKKQAEQKDRSCFSKTPEETSRLISENMKKIWSNPDRRKQRMKTALSPEFRKKQAEKQRIISENPNYGNSAVAAKKRARDPAWLKALSDKLKKAWSRDDGTRRLKASVLGKKFYKQNKNEMLKNRAEYLAALRTRHQVSCAKP